jgi:hypothetical protein
MKQKKQKNACPKTASKQNQATGKELFADHSKKPIVPGELPENPLRKDRIWSQTDYEASPILNAVINSFDTKNTVIAAGIINEMHERFAGIITGQLREHGVPFWAIDGQTFTLTLTFTKERPEGL